ncbi:MAG: restriction endonuclease subunit S [Planctomycetota bacterium]
MYGILMPGEHVEDGVPVVKVRNIVDGRIDAEQLLRTSREIDSCFERSRLRGGDILLTIRGTTGRVAVVPPILEGANITQDTARIRIEDDVVRGYVVHALASPYVERQIRLRTIGQAVKGINIACVRRLQLPMPASRSVQHRLAELFGHLDRACAAVGRAVHAKRRLKLSLLQQLVQGAGEGDGYRVRSRLGDVTRHLTTRNRGLFGPESVMGVLKSQGLVPMREGTIADDLSAYRRVPPRAFAYNPMRINIGSIAYSWHESDVLVSPDYVVFQCDESKLDPRYLDHLRHTSLWSQFVTAIGAGSVRVRIYYRDLARFAFPLPSLDEQHRIASVLDKIDAEIALLNRQLTAYRTLKRGVMQKLLTPKSEDEPAVTNTALATREARA